MNNRHGDETPQRLKSVHAKVAHAAEAAGRKAEDIGLIAVSKTFGPEDIRTAIDAGQTCFGENRVQEALGKWPDLKTSVPGIELHLIGPLQTNKARVAVELFDVIQTLDREKLARHLCDAAQEAGRMPEVFVQVNTGAEQQKSGVLPEDADQFLKNMRHEFGLNISGLMCIPPVNEEPSPHFALLEKIARRNGISGLSMGMSSDFERAIPFGATHIRVGQAIFGPRGQSPAADT